MLLKDFWKFIYNSTKKQLPIRLKERYDQDNLFECSPDLKSSVYFFVCRNE
jgi:hypothetical protein